jgi:hypothetical protein
MLEYLTARKFSRCMGGWCLLRLTVDGVVHRYRWPHKEHAVASSLFTAPIRALVYVGNDNYLLVAQDQSEYLLDGDAQVKNGTGQQARQYLISELDERVNEHFSWLLFNEKAEQLLRERRAAGGEVRRQLPYVREG